MIAYQTAWLKHYYPIEFLTANISSNINDTDNVVKLISDGRKMGITINHPDINKSNADFHIIDDNTLQYGLAAIKNVGYKAAEQIAKNRLRIGKYNSIFELITSGETTINKKVIESLILVGACESLGNHRAELFESMEIIIDFASKFQKDQHRNQESLFGDKSGASIVYPQLKKIESWSVEKELKHEKKLLGFYLSNNPLTKFEDDFVELSTLDSDGYNKYKTEYVQIGGIISNVNLRYDKNGNQWAILSLDTLSGTVQVYVFHNTYLEYLNFIKEDKIIFIQGKISNQSDNNKINQVIANKIHSPEGIRQKLTRKINIRIDYDQTNTQLLESVYQLFNENKGSYPVMFHMMTSQSRSQKIINKKILVSNDLDFLIKLRSFVGNKNVWLS